jgi:phosphoribosyl 1,2-cyclic phosphodiesterase
MEVNVIASGSGGNATVLSDGQTSLLLDAGIPFRQLMSKGVSISALSGCLLTHSHLDHSLAIKDLAKRGVDIYASQGTFDERDVRGHRYHAVKSLDHIHIGTFFVLPFDVLHDAAEPLGFWCVSEATDESAVYFSDTGYVKYTFQRFTHIIAECNYSHIGLIESVRNKVIEPELAARITRNHMSVERLIDFLRANDMSRLKQVHLIHMSKNNADVNRFKKAVQRCTGKEVYAYGD